MPPLRIVLSLAGIIAVIFAAYYATWFIGAKASGQGRNNLRNKNINLIDRFAISRDKSFCLVEIAGKVYVIGITNQSMTLLDTLDAAAFAETGAERRDAPAWNIPGNRFISGMTKRLATFMAHKMGRELDADEGSSSAKFADSMKNAREKGLSGQRDPMQAERTYDPEDKQ